ncbi:MAG: hypothetical protein K0S71_1597 [Clostridia bacterium]|nr:hypothetical protein [Clostridia bacterium]
MTIEFDNSKQNDLKANHLYEITLMTLVKDIKHSLAHDKLKECITALLEMGYSRRELKEYMNTFLNE